MKRIATIILTLALAAPALLAEEPAAQDSPLVAAAKRANRKGKKPTNVITNETLKKSGGSAHVTSAEKQAPLKMPAPDPVLRPTPEMIHHAKIDAERKKEEETAAAKKKAEEQRKAKIASAAERAEEEYPDDDDPADAERALGDAHGQSPEQKPPRD
jgi:hypothetical protein